MLGKFFYARFGVVGTSLSLEGEGAGHDSHGKSTAGLGDFGHDRRGTGSSAAAHAGCNEDHFGTGQSFFNGLLAFFSGLFTNGRIGAGSETARQFFT